MGRQRKEDEARTSQQPTRRGQLNSLLSLGWFHLFSSIPIFILPLNWHRWFPSSRFACTNLDPSSTVMRMRISMFRLHHQETLRSERST